MLPRRSRRCLLPRRPAPLARDADRAAFLMEECATTAGDRGLAVGELPEADPAAATALRDATLGRRAPRDVDAQPPGAHERLAAPLDDAEAREQRPAVARRLARGDDEHVTACEPVHPQRWAVARVPHLDHVVEREADTVDHDLVWHHPNRNTAVRSRSRELRCTGHARPGP